MKGLNKILNLFDTHTHYNDSQFDEDREKLIIDTLNSGVSNMVFVGYNEKNSEQAIELANSYNGIYATVGVHPSDIAKTEKDRKLQLEKIEQLGKKQKVVAVGEIGLDYHWDKENKDLQKEMFIKQIEIANKLDLPIVIHTRDAIEDTLDIVKNKIRANKKGIFHCCPLNRELVKEALKLGYYISLSGIITFKNSTNADEIINMIPDDKLLIETDSPYLSPEPKRGQRNDSRNVIYVAQKIASVKNMTLEEVTNITNKNAKMIFNII